MREAAWMLGLAQHLNLGDDGIACCSLRHLSVGADAQPHSPCFNFGVQSGRFVHVLLCPPPTFDSSH